MTKSGMTCAFIALLLFGFALCPTAAAQGSQANATGLNLRVGIFDSRAVAIAYARSEAFSLQIKSVRDEFEKAKSAGNEKRLAELNSEMTALQDLLHKQGFGTYSVSNILDKIKEQIPEIARQANVDVIVSKWDVAYQRPGIEFTDITDLLVKPFSPDEKTLAILKDLSKQKPIPLEELKNFRD